MNEIENALAPNIGEDYAKLNITYAGEQGDLPAPIPFDIDDDEVRRIAAEAIRAGTVPGIDADPTASLDGFIVKPYGARDGLPNRIVIRPATPYGKR